MAQAGGGEPEVAAHGGGEREEGEHQEGEEVADREQGEQRAIGGRRDDEREEQRRIREQRAVERQRQHEEDMQRKAKNLQAKQASAKRKSEIEKLELEIANIERLAPDVFTALEEREAMTYIREMMPEPYEVKQRLEFPDDESVVWGKILKKILITAVRTNENQVENAVLEICTLLLDRIARAQCTDLLQFAYKLQEALERLEWAVSIFKPEEIRTQFMNIYGRAAMKLFTSSLSPIESATWTAVRMTDIAAKDRIGEVIRFIQEKEEANVLSETVSKGAYPVKKRPSDKITKRTNVEGRYSEKTEESEPVCDEEPKEDPKSKKSKAKCDDDEDESVNAIHFNRGAHEKSQDIAMHDAIKQMMAKIEAMESRAHLQDRWRADTANESSERRSSRGGFSSRGGYRGGFNRYRGGYRRGGYEGPRERYNSYQAPTHRQEYRRRSPERAMREYA